MTIEHIDVLIVGAGLSGISAAYYIQTRCPTKSCAILEGRDTIGGTWDLFRYPGVRSDSDMHTLGYAFRPWRDAKAIADGPAILSYIRDTAHETGIEEKIRYGHKVQCAEWSSADALWRVEAIGPGGNVARFSCNFLYMCTGYYDYDSGYTPTWPGVEQFSGEVVHPQQWPENLDYAGKQVVVIGSGATAVTLVPALAAHAAHVTMVQRSPTYVVSMPSKDVIGNWLRRVLPEKVAYAITRWKSILLSMYFYLYAQWRPEATKRMIKRLTQEALGPDYDVDTHFTPRYNPWDQRLCLVPDADLFATIKSGGASIVTDQIATFTKTGLQLASGDEITADVVITATGLNMKLMSGVQLFVDGEQVDIARALSYKGAMYSDVPNLASAFGYTNASWTLKCELIAEYVCRLLNYMDQHGYCQCTPRNHDSSISEQSALNLTSGYIQRAAHTLPHQGSKKPWRMYQNYIRDVANFRFSKIDDGTMEFAGRRQPAPRRVREEVGA